MLRNVSNGFRTGMKIGEFFGDILFWLWFEDPPKSGGGTVSPPRMVLGESDDDE